MTTTTRPNSSVNARMRDQIVGNTEGPRKIGAITHDELRQTTIRMLGPDAVPKVAPLSPQEIAQVRDKAGVSQAVLARCLNVATNTVSQWGRGERHPTGAALKLLHVVKRDGIGPLL